MECWSNALCLTAVSPGSLVDHTHYGVRSRTRRSRHVLAPQSLDSEFRHERTKAALLFLNGVMDDVDRASTSYSNGQRVFGHLAEEQGNSPRIWDWHDVSQIGAAAVMQVAQRLLG
jgi:hypothetical protein